MRTNTTKAKLAAGQVVFGAIISRPAPDQVELFGAIGYDFVMIDCEHGPMSLDEVEHMVRAAEVFGITPITRIPNHEDSTILRFLDRGVQGIIVPHVNTRGAAEDVARAARYWPDGHRGVAGGRAHDYGVGVSRDESTRWINAELLVISMIEETEAVDNLDAILTVPGSTCCTSRPAISARAWATPARRRFARSCARSSPGSGRAASWSAWAAIRPPTPRGSRSSSSSAPTS